MFAILPYRRNADSSNPAQSEDRLLGVFPSSMTRYEVIQKINTTLIHIVKITTLSNHRTLSATRVREEESETRRKRWGIVGISGGRGGEMELVEVRGSVSERRERRDRGEKR